MVMMVALITGVGVLLLTIMTAVLRPNLALLPSEEYESGKDVSNRQIVCAGKMWWMVPSFSILITYHHLGVSFCQHAQLSLDKHYKFLLLKSQEKA